MLKKLSKQSAKLLVLCGFAHEHNIYIGDEDDLIVGVKMVCHSFSYEYDDCDACSCWDRLMWLYVEQSFRIDSEGEGSYTCDNPNRKNVFNWANSIIQRNHVKPRN